MPLIASLVLHVIDCYFCFTCHRLLPLNYLSLIATFIYMSLIPLLSTCHLLRLSNNMSLIAMFLSHIIDCYLHLHVLWIVIGCYFRLACHRLLSSLYKSLIVSFMYMSLIATFLCMSLIITFIWLVIGCYFSLTCHSLLPSLYMKLIVTFVFLCHGLLL